MENRFFIFRNTTVEPLFANIPGCFFSGYNDIEIPEGFDFYLWFYLLPFIDDKNLLAEEVNFLKSKLDFTARNIPVESRLICFTLENLLPFQFIEEGSGLQKEIFQYNNHISQLAREHSNFKIIHFDGFVSRYSREELIDWRHYYLSLVSISPKLSSAFQFWFLKKIDALDAVRKKCLVLDLDNTLWGGVLGEDGVEGVQIGNTYPGNCYSDLQSFVVEMKKTGVILALCSKNNESDVQEAFLKRKEIKLKLEDFSSIKINWKDKPDNIMEIAHELNIGLDSMVFLDDNPAERELASKMVPGLTVPGFPEKPYLFRGFLNSMYNDYFQVYSLTDEDKQKTAQYAKNALRQKEQEKFTSKKDFIKELGITLEIKEAEEINIPRIAQMTQKTNQFNLTTKRYSEPEIRNMLQKNYRVWYASVKDKFGSHGITALAIVKQDGEKAEFDSFLLSCRILGYGIEEVFLKVIINRLFKIGIKEVTTSFIPTTKNKQVEFFAENNGFKLLTINNRGIKNYLTKLDQEQKISMLYKIK